MGDDIELACNIARKWLPIITSEDKNRVKEIMTGDEKTCGNILLRKYVELLRPYAKIIGISGGTNGPHEIDCVASGIVFFYGCLIYIMHFPKWGEHIEDIFLYNLLYILVDHYIDDVNIDSNIKNKSISQMFILVNDPLMYKKLKLVDPVLKNIAKIYYRLITRCPKCKESIIKLFEAEIEGLYVQKTNNMRREDYYNIAAKKGGYTMEVLRDIMGYDGDNGETYKLGKIMQLIDDMLDVITDKTNGINTIATYDLENIGNLDTLWINIMDCIDDIGDTFTIFKLLYVLVMVYVPDRNKGTYTDRLRCSTNALNLFELNGSLMLVENIMNELNVMEILEPM